MNQTHISVQTMTQKSVCNISPNNINDNTNHNRHNNNNTSSISVGFFGVDLDSVQCVYFVSANVFVHVWEWFIFHILSFSCMCLAGTPPPLSVYLLLFFSVRWKDYFIECVTKNKTSRRHHLRRCQRSQKSTDQFVQMSNWGSATKCLL